MDLINQLLENGLVDEQTADFLRRQINPQQLQSDVENQVLNLFLNRLSRQLELFLDEAENISLTEFSEVVEDLWNDSSLDISAQLANIAVDQVLPVKVGGLLEDEQILESFNVLNQRVLTFVTEYYVDSNVGSLPQLDRTSREQLRNVFTLWLRGDLEGSGLPVLEDALQPIFGVQRASRIAATETARIFGEVTKQISEESNLKTGLRWDTAEDELVCPICEPLNGVISQDNERFRHPELGIIHHPAHVNCRCDLTVVVL